MTNVPDEKAWVIRDVPEATRRKVKKWAGEWGVTIAEALERLVDSGDRVESNVVSMQTTGEIEGTRIIPTDDVSQLFQLAKMVADLIEKRRQEQEAKGE